MGFKVERSGARLHNFIPEIIPKQRKRAERNLTAAAAMLDDAIKDDLNEPYPRASKPGEHPHKRSGRLQRETGARVNLATLTLEAFTSCTYYAKLVASGRLGVRASVERVRGLLNEIMRRR
jgi:hypothetical protein